VLGVRADRGAVGTRRSENRSPNHGSLIRGVSRQRHILLGN